jgi:hypothetical protein
LPSSRKPFSPIPHLSRRTTAKTAGIGRKNGLSGIRAAAGTPYKKLYDPRKWLREGETHLVTRLNEAFADLKSAGKLLACGSCGGGKKPACG